MQPRNSSSKPIAEINVVPYIDVMLVLLVIFMITAPMLTQGVMVDLPKTISENLQTTENEPIIVSVNQHGDYFLNVHETPDIPIAAKDLVLKVAAIITVATETKQPMPIVLVKGDQGVTYGKVVTAMALLQQAGASQVGLLTESPNTQLAQEHAT